MTKTPKTTATAKAKPTRAKTASTKTKGEKTLKDKGESMPKPAEKTKPEALKTAPQPQPQPQPEPEPQLFDADTVRSLEALSVNIAKATMTAQSALAKTVFKQPDIEGSGPVDPFQVGPAMTQVMNSLATKPDKVVEAQSSLLNGYLELWAQMARRSMGLAPADDETKPVRDKRFSDPRWDENLMFDMMRQSYLLSSNWLNDLIASVDDIDPIVKRRAEFFTKLLTDAMSPANFLMTNPVAINALIESKGETLVKGMQKFADDLARGDGKLKISQADDSRFKVGETVATTPGKVIYRGTYFELLQYAPTTDEVYETPLLIFPPWINKFYILDLQAKNSLIKWLVGQGFTVFVVSWVNPDASLKDTTFDDYLFGGIYEATQKVLEQTGVKQVNTVGYCIGGTLLGCALAHMADKGDTSIKSATFFTAQHDFTEAGDLLLFTSETWLKELERQMDAAGGVLPGAAMADTFNSLRANDLIWSFFVSNYLMGKDLAPFDLLCWNGDQTRMAKALHIFYLRKFYGQNALARGELVLGGVRLDPKKVTIPIYEQAGREDHIAPPASVYKGSKLFGGPVTYMLAGSGHIAGVVNPPAAQKYMHWLNDAHPDTLEEWLAGATEHPGSWWPHWAAWLAKLSGDKVPGRDPAQGALTPLGDAPGTYVMVKS